MDWASSLPPHIQPPIAHVPRPTRDVVTPGFADRNLLHGLAPQGGFCLHSNGKTGYMLPIEICDGIVLRFRLIVNAGGAGWLRRRSWLAPRSGIANADQKSNFMLGRR
jgi:hypothetical protein